MCVFIFHFIACILFEMKVQEASKISDIHFIMCSFLAMCCILYAFKYIIDSVFMIIQVLKIL